MGTEFAVAFLQFKVAIDSEKKMELLKRAISLMKIEDASFQLLSHLSQEYTPGLLPMKVAMFNIDYFYKDAPSFCDFFSYKSIEDIDYWPFEIKCKYCSEVLTKALEWITQYDVPESISYDQVVASINDLHEQHCVYAPQSIIDDYAERLLSQA